MRQNRDYIPYVLLDGFKVSAHFISFHFIIITEQTAQQVSSGPSIASNVFIVFISIATAVAPPTHNKVYVREWMSIIKEKREDIIRSLDVLNVGPYLVRNGVLSQRKYTEEFSSLIEDGRAANDELTPRLYEVIVKKPVEFCKALDEAIKETQHGGHQELLILLQQNMVCDIIDTPHSNVAMQ